VDAIQGAPEIPDGEGLEIGVRMVDDAHFEALGIPVLRGRAFDRRDGTDPLPTVIVNQYAAERLFPGEDPLGRFIELGVGSGDREPMAEIVGVVGDVLYNGPDVGIIPEAYYSYREFPENHGNVTIRTTGDPMAVVPAVRATLASIDPTLALYGMETMDRIIARSVGDRRTTLALLSIFAALAIVLAATGTWGIVAYSVADRRRELGLRMALGAERGSVVRTVVGEGFRTAVFGIAVGLGLGLAASRLLGAILWETEPTEPLVYVSGSALLFAVVLIASWMPARNAARVDPVEALRAE
jgi:putative ABC transport system permease protein